MLDLLRDFDAIDALLAEVAVPGGVHVERRLRTPPALGDVRAAVHAALGAVEMPRGSVAIGVGSRGIGRIGDIVAALVAELRAGGARPFIVPAMGSHGASTAAGQAKVLAQLGVDEERCGAPVRATMESVEVGRTADGVPAYLDVNAAQADAIVVVNRVKPHTAFRGPIESGPTKMIAIGLGKQRGAHVVHARGWGEIHRTIPAVAEVSLRSGKIAFALAILENAEEQPTRLVAIPAARLLAEEPALQAQAKELLPHLPFERLDVLVVDRIGKNISGDGADPNVTGRYPTPFASGGPKVTRMVFCDLTDESHGNANGLGMADVVTARLATRFVPSATYLNALTSTTPEPTRLPMVMPDADRALRAALLMCAGVDPRRARIARILDTLHLGSFWISDALAQEVGADSALRAIERVARFPMPAFEPLALA
jgi:hypothetical protein